MKRKIALILSLLLILLTACNTNNLLEYKKAAEKREQITKGQTSGAFTVITEINRDGLTAEEIKELNYIKLKIFPPDCYSTMGLRIRLFF